MEEELKELYYVLISILIFIVLLGVLPLELLIKITSFNLLKYSLTISYFLEIYITGVYFLFMYFSVIDFRNDLTIFKKLLMTYFWFFYILLEIILIIKQKICH